MYPGYRVAVYRGDELLGPFVLRRRFSKPFRREWPFYWAPLSLKTLKENRRLIAAGDRVRVVARFEEESSMYYVRQPNGRWRTTSDEGAL